MIRSKNTITDMRSQNLPLGAYAEKDGSCRFSVSLPKALYCLLCICDDKGRVIEEREMQRNKNGIFTTVVEKTP